MNLFVDSNFANGVRNINASKKNGSTGSLSNHEPSNNSRKSFSLTGYPIIPY